MYRIGPLDRLRAVTQRLEREGSYWINQVTRLVRGARSRRPQTMDLDDFNVDGVVTGLQGEK